MSLRIVGSYEPPVRENRVPFSLEKLAVKLSPAPELKMEVSSYHDYHDAAKSGWYISFSVDKLHGRVNEEPFKDQKSAEEAYEKVLREVCKGDFALEYDLHDLKLRFTNSSMKI